MKKQQKQERLALSLRETADALGVCYQTICDLARRQKIPTVKIGNRRFVPVEELKRWVGQGGERGVDGE